MPPTASRGPDAIGKAAAATPALSVRRIVLANFRSYPRAEFLSDGRSVVLAGPNGAGKTNLLDAISLLSPGRGLRGAKLSEHTRRGPVFAGGERWAVAATISRAGVEYEVGTGLIQGPSGGERRQVRLNGETAQSSADLGELAQIMWLTPTMDRLFTEGANGRRRFLDRLVLSVVPAHARHSLRYENAMRERSRLLKHGPRDPTWLDGLEEEMAEAGLSIARGRADAIKHLNAALSERADAGQFPAAQLFLVGDTDVLVAEHDDEHAVRLMRQKLAALRVRDAEAGRTGFGPHTSDLAVRHTAKRADARECSTGEQKALLISIILADAWMLTQRRNGVSPILLLDEVAAHLDAERRRALFDEIVTLGAQSWLTGTDLHLFRELTGRAQLVAVKDGAFAVQNV